MMSPYCKIAEEENYENCGPDAEGDYCLFHKPDKNEEEAERFYVEIKDKGRIEETEDGIKRLVFEQKLDWQGFVFPEVPKEIDPSLFFKSSFFKKKINLKDGRFKDMATFTGSLFEKESIFKYVEFERGCEFNEVIFKGESSFKESTFEDKSEKVSEIYPATFDYSYFKGKCDFTLSVFYSICSFQGAIFENDAEFYSIRVKRDDESQPPEFNLTCFEETTFKDRCNFTDAIFEGICNFERSRYEGYTTFSIVKFNMGCVFRDAVFSGEVSFGDTEFKIEGIFENTTFEKRADFSEVKFEGEAIFESASFRGSVEYNETEFHNKLALKNLHLERGIDLEGEREYYEKEQAWEEVSRVLKQNYEENGNKDKADKWFVEERRAIRKQNKEKGSRFEKIKAFFEWLIADVSCEYGTNWIRLFVWTAGIILSFPFFYFIGNKIERMGYIEGMSGGLLANLGDCFYYSVVTFTTLGYGDMSPVGPIMKLLSSIQSFLGAVFMALIVVVLARKWMR